MNLIAIAISDLHLSLLRPACRADKDWMQTQADYLDQVKTFKEELQEKECTPITLLCAGDIFDRWNASPELINFALDHLPDDMICVPGQHDLPNHRMDQVHRSGYGVLVKAKKIRDISGQVTGNLGGFQVHGFGWGQPLTNSSNREGIEKKLHQVALIHQYCWVSDRCYPGAPQEAHISSFKKQLEGFDVAVFGDNHIGFTAMLKRCNVLNTGGFIRRKSDEIGRTPSIGIIYEDGTVQLKKLDASIDEFQNKPEDRPEVPLDLKSFMEGLEGLGEHGLNFIEAVENHLRREDVDPQTKKIILEVIGK